jgi:hypothetical protein
MNECPHDGNIHPDSHFTEKNGRQHLCPARETPL